MVTTQEQADMGKTSIQVSDELADELHARKERGDSYEDVIWRLVEENDEADE
jgi:predicted CopG family antitoxin